MKSMAGWFGRNDAGRNDAAIAAALEAVAQAVGNQPVGVDAASRSLASPAGRCSFEGAATTHRIPASVNDRASPNPVGPAS